MTIDITIDALELLDPFEPGFHADPAISYDHVQVLSLNLFFFFFFITCIMWKDNNSYFSCLVVLSEICITCLRHDTQEALNNPFLL